MLEPQSRRVLLDALAPPTGYRFDRAIGTTFTLDLLAMLTAPLAFSLIDITDDDGGRPVVDPLALLEAAQRHAGRIAIFTDAGYVAVPKPGQPLLTLLEESVVPVVAPRAGALFHPKMWLVRYVADDGPRVLRLLCSSRNLTFDRSWDTLLVLDGTVTDTPVETSTPLARFVGALPRMAVTSPAERIQEDVGSLAADVRRTHFEGPPNMDLVAFHPLGIDPGTVDEQLPESYRELRTVVHSERVEGGFKKWAVVADEADARTMLWHAAAQAELRGIATSRNPSPTGPLPETAPVRKFSPVMPVTADVMYRPTDIPNETYVFTAGQDVHLAGLDDYAPGAREAWSWTGQRDMRRGAFVITYVASPVSAFCWIGRACSDSEVPPSNSRACLWIEMHPLSSPISLAEARAHPVIGTWSAIAGSATLQGSSRRVRQSEAWNALVKLVVERNPEISELLREWTTTPPPEPPGALDDFVWEGGPGWDYPFHRERLIQEGTRDYFIVADAYRLPAAEDGEWMQDLEARLGKANRADILLVSEREERSLLLIETKLFAVTAEGVEQVQRYARWIHDHHPGWSIRSLLVAQEFSDSTLDRADRAGVECWQVGWAEDVDGYSVEDDIDVVIWQVGAAGPERSAEELDTLEQRLAREIVSAPRFALADTGGAPDRAGLLAVWAADDSVGDRLGLRRGAHAQPIWVEAVGHIGKALDPAFMAESALGNVLRQYLGAGLGDLPWWWSEGTVGNAIAGWLGARIRVSWVEAEDVAALRLRVARRLVAALNGLLTDEPEDLEQRLTQPAVAAALVLDGVLEWLAYAEESLGDWLELPAGSSVLVPSDIDAHPMGWREASDVDGPSSVYLSARTLADPQGELGALEPSGWKNADPAFGISPPWMTAVEELDTESAVALHVLLQARPIVEAAVQRRG